MTTAIASAGYGLVIAVAARRGALGNSPHHHVIALAALLILASMVAMQVRRDRALSRYYERRPL